MYVVIVDFAIKREHAVAFAKAVSENARTSTGKEPACRQFDV